MIAAALLAAAVAGPLILDARASHTNVLAGETVRIDVTWRATGEVTVIADDPTTGVGAFKLMIDDGRGTVRYLEAGSVAGDITTAPLTLQRGQEFVQSHWFRRRLDGGIERELFERPGVVTLQVVYEDPTRGVLAAANPIRFTVSAPSGADASLLQQLRRRPRLDHSVTELAELVAAYPSSRYTPHLKLKLHGARQLLLMQHRDPDTLQSLDGLNRQAFEAVARRVHAAAAQDLLDGPEWSVLEADRLAAAVRAAEHGGDADRATRARAALFERFASSGPAKDIQRDDARGAARR